LTESCHGPIVTIELSIQGTFRIPMKTTASVTQPTGARVNTQDRTIRLLQLRMRKESTSQRNPLTSLFSMPGRMHVTHRAFATKTAIFLTWRILGARHATFPFYGALF